MLAKDEHKVLFFLPYTQPLSNVKLRGGEGNVSIQTLRDQIHALLSWERYAYELPPQIPQRIGVERNPAYMPVLVNRPSLAVDELIVTHTVMLSGFYTPM